MIVLAALRRGPTATRRSAVVMSTSPASGSVRAEPKDMLRLTLSVREQQTLSIVTVLPSPLTRRRLGTSRR